MPKRSRSGVVSRPGPRRRADQRELGEIDAHRPRRRPLADDEVELEILHRRIEDLLDRRIEAMDLVDEQHIAVFEIGEQRRQIPGLRDHRPRCGTEPDAKLLGHNLGQRRLAEAGRPRKQHMVERVTARLRRFDEHAQVCARLLLANELCERARTDASPRRRPVRASPR